MRKGVARGSHGDDPCPTIKLAFAFHEGQRRAMVPSGKRTTRTKSVFRQNTPWDRGDPLWRCTPQRHGVTRLKVSKTSWSAINPTLPAPKRTRLATDQTKLISKTETHNQSDHCGTPTLLVVNAPGIALALPQVQATSI
jgi:hypothetical protein